jgi:hypothetical protein
MERVLEALVDKRVVIQWDPCIPDLLGSVIDYPSSTLACIVRGIAPGFILVRMETEDSPEAWISLSRIAAMKLID